MMVSHKWSPITPAPGDFAYNFEEIDSLQRQWLAVKQQREAASPDAYRRFLDRLTRHWSIETGIIEGLYTLDRGVTETLVMRGISAELIEQSATNKDPRELARILHDHQDAMTYVYQQIREGRPITRSAIRQLHAALTQNQPTYRAVDQFGRGFDATLQRGAFKTMPNNPSRPDGTVHEYCPPEHVDSELDNLLEWYGAYIRDTARYHSLLTAAWLHHRFTQIHPFADGNGRVVRALLAWHLAQQDYLPVVITRDRRAAYIAALECADAGNLAPFVDLLAVLQKQAILDVLGASEISERPALVEQVLDHIVAQVSRRNEEREADLRQADQVALKLRDGIADMLAAQERQIVSSFRQIGTSVTSFIDRGGPGDREHWYRSQIVRTAVNSGHWANWNEARFFVKLSLAPDRASGYPRLVFVVSLHHTGRQLTGIMTATAFALVGRQQPSSIAETEEGADDSFTDCTPEPFTFTWENDPENLLPRCARWTEQCLAMALRQWSEHLY